MNNFNICKKCGYQNISNSNYCTNCGEKIEKENSLNNGNTYFRNNSLKDDKIKEGDKLAIISLILFFGLSSILYIFEDLIVIGSSNIFFNQIINTLVSIAPIGGIITMVVGRVKYPNNKFLKVVMWIFIVCIILGVISLILFMALCYISCNNGGCEGIY